MPRVAKPTVDKIRESILEQPPEDQEAMLEWLELVIEVREADKKAAEKRAAAAGGVKSSPNLS